MNKNKICREVLDIKEFLESRVSEQIASISGLSVQEKKEVIAKLNANVTKSFNVVVDKILQS